MINITPVLEAIQTLAGYLNPPILSGKWTSWEAGDRQNLSAVMHTINDLYNGMVKPKYDQDVYAGNEHKLFVGNTATFTDAAGKVTEVRQNELRPVRKQTVKDGNKTEAAQPTAEELVLAAFMKQAGIVATQPELESDDVSAE